jgi:cellulose synthase/poly-beta-1,6-N-acetylglucosamine synthase-like glycosyltransferase
MFYLLIILSLITLLVITGYSWIILNSVSGLRKLDRKIPPGRDDSTCFTIIIPFRNESPNLKNIFHDLTNQDYPGEKYEIVFVNDHSTDDGEEVLQRMADANSNGRRIRILSLHKGGIEAGSKKEAITYGISKSVHNVIITTDADCRMSKQWLRTLSGFYQQHNWRLFWGPVVYEQRKGFFAGFFRLDFLSMVAVGGGAAVMGTPFICNGANLVYEKSLFAEVNGFDGNEKSASGDDVFLLHKAVSHFGHEIIGFAYHRNAIVNTASPATLSEFLKQRMRWGGKTPGYESRFAKITAVTVYLLHLLMSVFLVGGFFHSYYIIPFALLFMVKLFVDLYLIKSFLITEPIKMLPLKIFLYEWIYLPYIVIAGTGSLFSGKRWKDRDFKG